MVAVSRRQDCYSRWKARAALVYSKYKVDDEDGDEDPLEVTISLKWLAFEFLLDEDEDDEMDGLVTVSKPLGDG